MLTACAVAQIEEKGKVVFGLVPKSTKTPAKLLQQYQARGRGRLQWWRMMMCTDWYLAIAGMDYSLLRGLYGSCDVISGVGWTTQRMESNTCTALPHRLCLHQNY